MQENIDSVLPALCVIVFIFGCCIGSFATFCGHRIFSDNLSLTGARSVCTTCLSVIQKRAMVPILSYLFYFGRCTKCGNAISARYPIIEACTGLFCLCAFLCFGISFKTAALWIVIVCCFIQIASDIEYYMASDLVDLIMLFAVVLLVFLDGKRLQDALLFAFYGLLFMLFCRQLVMWRLKRDPLGLGDVKIVTIMAPLCSSETELLLTFAMFGIFGAIFGILWQRYAKSDIFPFAPPIMIAFLIDYLLVSGILSKNI